MDKDKLYQRLMETFLGELEDHVAALNRDLLALEKEPPAEKRAASLKTLFRSAHSLKGAARAVGVTPLESVCHELEELLYAAQHAKLSLGSEHFELLYAATDAIADAGKALRAKKTLDAGPLTEITQKLATAAARSAEREVIEPRTSDGEREAPVPTTTVAEPSVMPPADDTAFVRIPAAKLDALLAQSGELLLARHRVGSRREALGALQEFVREWETEWCGVEKIVTKLTESASSAEDNGAIQKHLVRRVAPSLGRIGANVRRLERDLERLTVALAQDGRVLDNASSGIEQEVRRVRMLRFSEACQGLNRMVRDLAKEKGKKIELSIVGGDVELDRSILEALKDPLVHLVRNAVDHGVESTEERRAAGKPVTAKVVVSAALRASRIEITVSDDGRGLDLDEIRAKAIKKKLAVPEDDEEVARLIFLPGFSTSPIITEVSGRGVGMDVVKSRVEALRGSVEIATESDRGTRIILTVPLTLTTLRVVLVRTSDHVFAFDTSAVRRLLRVPPGDFRSVEGREVIFVDGSPAPAALLAQTLGLVARGGVKSASEVPVVVVGEGNKMVAFAVDELHAEQEVVIKSLGNRLKRLRHVSGATILPTGRVALILNDAELIRTALGRITAGAPTPLMGEEEVSKRLLVVDDSVTARSLLRSALEGAGYEVAVAVDGAEAWQLLQENGADLVVSDVEMPRMDGFALTEAIKGSSQFRELPVVLVTARSTDQDKARGMELGADAYLIKSSFDQQSLLDAIAQLI